MCRPKGHPGENGGVVSVARSSIWTSTGVAFSCCPLPGVIRAEDKSQRRRRGVFFPVCYQKGFKCFLADWFQLPGAANMRKDAQIAVGSFENRVSANATKRRRGVSWELPM